MAVRCRHRAALSSGARVCADALDDDRSPAGLAAGDRIGLAKQEPVTERVVQGVR
jgi:hypothetical protein